MHSSMCTFSCARERSGHIHPGFGHELYTKGHWTTSLVFSALDKALAADFLSFDYLLSQPQLHK